MKNLARLAYGVFGVLAIGLGIVAVFRPALALPGEAFSPLTAHLIQEQGSEGVFIGLMAFWCLFHFDHRRPVHFGLVLFTGIFAGIHWAEYLHGRRPLTSPLANSVPFLLFLVTAPFKNGSEQSMTLAAVGREDLEGGG